MLFQESILCKGLAGFLDSGELLRRTEIWIELPNLPSDVIIGGSKPWTASFGDLQFPHNLLGENEDAA